MLFVICLFIRMETLNFHKVCNSRTDVSGVCGIYYFLFDKLWYLMMCFGWRFSILRGKYWFSDIAINIANIKYRKTSQDIIQRKYQNLLLFTESYSGDNRQVQNGFRLGINEQTFLISWIAVKQCLIGITVLVRIFPEGPT